MLAACIASGTALIIAIFVYPLQKRKDREIQIHSEKRQLYREFLRQIETVTILKRVDDWFRTDAFRKLDGLFAEVQLLSSNDVNEQASRLIIAINTKFMSDDEKIIGSDGKERSLNANIFHERDQLVQAMRIELMGPE